MRFLLILLSIFCLGLATIGCAGSADDDGTSDLISAVIAGGRALVDKDAITVAPSSVLPLQLILSDTSRPPSAFRWTATNGGVLASPSTKDNSLEVGDTPKTIVVRVEVDVPQGTSVPPKTYALTFEVIVSTTLTRLIKSISVDRIAHKNNDAFDINGARTVSIVVEYLSGITPTTATGSATRGFIGPFSRDTKPHVDFSTWIMPNTPGIDVITVTVEGSDGTLTGAETWQLTANVK